MSTRVDDDKRPNPPSMRDYKSVVTALKNDPTGGKASAHARKQVERDARLLAQQKALSARLLKSRGVV